MFILGSAQTKFGNHEKSMDQLIFEAINNSLIDANLEIKDIKATIFSNNLSYFTENQAHYSAIIPSIVGLDQAVFSTEAACASGGQAFFKGCQLLSSFDPILIVGAEKMTDFSTKEMLDYVAMDSDFELEHREGLIFPAAGALVADAYMRKYSITLDDLTEISLKNHCNGKLNSFSHFYQKDVTREMINSSPVLCSPLRLFDCSVNSDGACAIIISKKKRKNSVKILSSFSKSYDLSTFGPKNPIEFPQIRECTNSALKQANLKLSDIDFFEIHDGFSIMELIVAENIGLFEKGKGKFAYRDGITSLNGKKPINTTGGLKACGHPLGATGLRQIHDLKRQILHKADKNQINKANIGFAFNFGSIFKTISVTILSN